MMRLLLHGPAKSASRKKLIDIKAKFDPNNVVVFEEDADLKTIKEGLVAQSLFSDDQLIILENPPDDFACNLSPVTCNLLLWFDREIDPKKYPDFEISFFPESKEISVFPFLDLLAAKDKEAFLELQRLKNAGFDIYYVLTMAFYLLRSLAVTPKRAQDFQKRKLERQRLNFGLEKVKELYKDLLQIDFKLKSGLLPKDQAEFLLVNKFLYF